MAGFIVEKGMEISIDIDEKEPSAVQIAAENLKTDLMRVLKTEAALNKKESSVKILVGTIGVSKKLAGCFAPDKLQDERGNFRKEAYIQTI